MSTWKCKNCGLINTDKQQQCQACFSTATNKIRSTSIYINYSKYSDIINYWFRIFSNKSISIDNTIQSSFEYYNEYKILNFSPIFYKQKYTELVDNNKCMKMKWLKEYNSNNIDWEIVESYNGTDYIFFDINSIHSGIHCFRIQILNMGNSILLGSIGIAIAPKKHHKEFNNMHYEKQWFGESAGCRTLYPIDKDIKNNGCYLDHPAAQRAYIDILFDADKRELKLTTIGEMNYDKKWIVDDIEKLQYDELFNLLVIKSYNQQNKINKTDVLSSVMKEHLIVFQDTDLLQRIWNFADIDGDDHLDYDEFILFMHLLNLARRGKETNKYPIPSHRLPIEAIPSRKIHLIPKNVSIIYGVEVIEIGYVPVITVPAFCVSYQTEIRIASIPTNMFGKPVINLFHHNEV